MNHEGRYLYFDFVRGLSAIAVAAGHLRAAILVDYSSIQSASVGTKAFYFLTGLGHQSVMVFFVLSGFFVGGSVLGKHDSFSWTRYASARLTRLYIVLVPSLLMTCLVDGVMREFSPAVINGVYRQLWSSGPEPNAYAAGAATFAGNMLFLQTISVPVYGTNSPLWSLANEFWYYVLFPVAMCATGILRPANYLLRLAAGIIAIGLLFWLPHALLMAFLVWLLGVGVWLTSLRRRVRFEKHLAWFGLCIFLASLAYSKLASPGRNAALPEDFVVGLGFVFLAVPLCRMPNPSVFGRTLGSFSRGISEVSYSLYLFHFPLVVLIAGLVYQDQQLRPDYYGYIQFFFWLLVLMLVCTGFWWVFERRTAQARIFLQTKFERMAHRGQ